jgi:hypothetical protein
MSCSGLHLFYTVIIFGLGNQTTFSLHFSWYQQCIWWSWTYPSKQLENVYNWSTLRYNIYVPSYITSLMCFFCKQSNYFCFKGFYFISNPFTKSGIEYWIQQSFENYCLPPNPTNISLKDKTDLKNCNDDIILQKLRWATLGYHHNWDTKVCCQ